MNTGILLKTLKLEDQLEDVSIDKMILKPILEQFLCEGNELDSSQNRN